MNINKMIDNDYLKRDIFWFYLATKLYAKYYIRKIYLFFAQRRKLGYPHTLQFPITNKCNLDCVMCNIHGNDSKNELSKDEISRILQDSIFKKVESVGVNGGEPFILKIWLNI